MNRTSNLRNVAERLFSTRISFTALALAIWAISFPLPRLYSFAPNDPYFHTGNPVGFPGQWYLDKQASGAIYDVNIAGAWNRGLTGEGVTIGIVDHGLQHTHPDLLPNYAPEDSFDFLERDADPSPSPVDAFENHGMPVAGLAAARGGNGIGITGAAPHAKLAGLRINLGDVTNDIDAILHHSSSFDASIDIKNHSYGFNIPYETVSAHVHALAISQAYGTIHVYSAGNQRECHNECYFIESDNDVFDPDVDLAYSADANTKHYLTSANVITVAALGSSGTFATYSNWGANVWVTAPSGSDRDGEFNITSTDRTSNNGTTGGINNAPGDSDDDTFPDLNYTSTFNGTSASAPLVAGILALGKQAQPKLNTRFAKHLLARTSVVVDPDDQSDTGFWITNAAGYNFNPNYGFGLIDADAFTREAVRYSDVTPLTSEIVDTQVVNRAIPDVDFISERFTLTGQEPLEEIEIHLDIDHEWRGSLIATLISPSGAGSNLMLHNEYDSLDKINWTFVTNAFWGEIPAGEWELYVGDVFEDGIAGTWNSFRVLARMGTLIPIPTVPGDYNGDSVVDAADYVVWRNTLGSAINLAADGNGNQQIDQGDYDVWQSNFGRTASAVASMDDNLRAAQTGVPEPSTWLLAVVGSFAVLSRVRRTLSRI
jgi:hypothetical protein